MEYKINLHNGCYGPKMESDNRRKGRLKSVAQYATDGWPQRNKRQFLAQFTALLKTMQPLISANIIKVVVKLAAEFYKEYTGYKKLHTEACKNRRSDGKLHEQLAAVLLYLLHYVPNDALLEDIATNTFADNDTATHCQEISTIVRQYYNMFGKKRESAATRDARDAEALGDLIAQFRQTVLDRPEVHSSRLGHKALVHKMAPSPVRKKFYVVLGIQTDATEVQIKAAYRKKARESHPDRGGDAQVFNEVTEAYNVLSDPEKRQAYDNARTQGAACAAGRGHKGLTTTALPQEQSFFLTAVWDGKSTLVMRLNNIMTRCGLGPCVSQRFIDVLTQLDRQIGNLMKGLQVEEPKHASDSVPQFGSKGAYTQTLGWFLALFHVFNNLDEGIDANTAEVLTVIMEKNLLPRVEKCGNTDVYHAQVGKYSKDLFRKFAFTLSLSSVLFRRECINVYDAICKTHQPKLLATDDGGQPEPDLYMLNGTDEHKLAFLPMVLQPVIQGTWFNKGKELPEMALTLKNVQVPHEDTRVKDHAAKPRRAKTKW